MINAKLVYKIIGQLLFLEAVMMMICTGMSVYCHEDDVMAFGISIAITIAAAFMLKYLGREADNMLGRRDTYLVVTLIWVAFSVFGSLPYLISGYINNPTDAFFETMSGFTTTGCSIISDVERLPHGLLAWRTMTQWIGGLGIVFFTIAVLPSMVGGNVKVFAAEATGPLRAKLHPRLSTTAKWIWSIYIILTGSCAVCYYLSGMGLFDSANYAMTTTATGGFATHNDSTAYFQSAWVDYTAITFMFLSGVSFTVLYSTLLKGHIRMFFKNAEFKFYASSVVIATLVIAGILIYDNSYDLLDALRTSLFQVVSFITTTGIFSDDASQWHHITWVILGACMIVGACSGSTTGGLKCIRVVMLFTILRNELKRILHPRAVLPVKVNDNSIPYSSQVTLLAFFTAYILMCMFTFVVMILTGIDSTNAITIAISCASNVGPGLEMIGPPMSWDMLPTAIKWLLSGLMLMGRLEILSVVVLFTPAFWKDN